MRSAAFLSFNICILLFFQICGVFCHDHHTFNFEDVSTAYPEHEDEQEVTANFFVKAKFHYDFSLNDKYSVFLYSLYEEHQPLLKFPHKLEHVQFNEVSLNFDDKAVLPQFPAWSLTVLTCENGGPAWLRLHGNGGFYFYALNAETRRWTNYTVNHLREFEHTDANGAKFYKLNAVNGYIKLYDHLPEQCAELTKHSHFDPDEHEGLDEPPLELHLKSVRQAHKYHPETGHEHYVFTPELDFQSELEQNFATSFYHVEDEDRHEFRYPNKLVQLKYNNKVLAFDTDAKLPRAYSWSVVSVYACNHSNPILVRLHSSDGYIFFAPDSTGKWKNHTVNSLKALEYRDESGVKVYKYTTVDGFKKLVTGLAEEGLQLAKTLCNEHQHPHGFLPEKPVLEVKLKLVELDDLSDFLFLGSDFGHGGRSDGDEEL